MNPNSNLAYKPSADAQWQLGFKRYQRIEGVITLPEGTEMVMPGDNVLMTVELITPIAMEKEHRFAIREGGHTVGSGVVTEIIVA